MNPVGTEMARPNLAGFAFAFVRAICLALLVFLGAIWLIGGGC